MTENFLSLTEFNRCGKPVDLDAWEEWERHVAVWQLSGGVKQATAPGDHDESSFLNGVQTFTGADVFIAGRCTAFQKRPGSAPAGRRRRPSSASSTSSATGIAAAESMAPSASFGSIRKASAMTSGLDASRQAAASQAAQQALQESLIHHSSKEMRLRLKALGNSSKASSVPRSRIPLRPEPPLPSSLTPRSVLALEASIAQGNLRCKRLQALVERKPGEKDELSFDDKAKEAQNLKELLAQISGSLTLGKAAEAELHQFQKSLHGIKITLAKQERRQQWLAKSNAELKESNFIAKVQAGLGGGQQQRSRSRLQNSSGEVKLKRVLTHLEGSAGSIADRGFTSVEERRRLLEASSRDLKGCGTYKDKCRRTATAEGLQQTLIDLLRQRERVSQYRDDSVAMEREMSKKVQVLRNELNSVEF